MLNRKLLKIIAVAFLICSLGCSSPPHLVESPCVLDPEQEVAYCTPPGGNQFEIPIEVMSGYSCFSLADTETLITWIKRHSKNKLTTHQRVKLLHEIERVVWSQERANGLHTN